MDSIIEYLGVWAYLAVLIIGLLGGFLGAIAGGRTLICISLLLIFGVPVDIAVASSKFGSLGYSIGGFKKFLKSGYISWKHVIPFSILAMIGGYIGSNLMVSIDPRLLVPIISIILLLLLPVLFVYKKFGEVHLHRSKWYEYLGYLLYFGAAIYGGFFGGGVGMIVTYICIFCFGFTILHIKATTLLPWFLLNCVAVYVFFTNGLVDLFIGLILFLGMMLGAYIGAHVALKKGNKRLKPILAGFIVLSVIKLLYPYISFNF